MSAEEDQETVTDTPAVVVTMLVRAERAYVLQVMRILIWLAWWLLLSYDAPLAQLVERQSHNLKVASLSLAGSTSLPLFALSASAISYGVYTTPTASYAPMVHRTFHYNI